MTEKCCRTCKLVKPLADFQKGQPMCRPCRRTQRQAEYRANPAPRKAAAKAWYHSNRDLAKKRHDEWRKKNPTAHRKSYYRKVYGITPEERVAQISVQGAACAICKRSFSEMPDRHVHVDHDHKTGQVRGILCHWCNTRLGVLESDENWLMAVREYLATGGVWAVVSEPGSASLKAVA